MRRRNGALIALVTAGFLAVAPAPLTGQEVPAVDTAHETALALLAQGEGPAARAVLEESPFEARPHAALLLGTLRREAGELDRALDAFEVALAQAPKDLQAVVWAEVGVTRSWQGDLTGAEAAYRAAVGADPSSVAGRSGLARVLRWQERWSEAEVLYDGLVAEQVGLADALTGLGYVALARLDGAEAARRFHGALELEPGLVEAREGLARLHEADRLAISWSVTATGQEGRTRQAAASASYRITPRSTVRANLDLAPFTDEVVGSNPNASSLTGIRWSAAAGWSQRLTSAWSAGATVERIQGRDGAGHRLTVESGRWFGSRWTASGGVRAGRLPEIGTEAMGWAGVTRIGSSRRAASLTLFHGTDLREAWSTSLLLGASTGFGEALTFRATLAHGWSSTVGFRQGTLEARWRPGTSGREFTAELFTFDGAYERSGIRFGARIGL